MNWINSYLSKRKPPMRVENLIEDLKDGVRISNHNCQNDDDDDLKDGVRMDNYASVQLNTSSQVRLLALLEVLSGERLPMERGRVLRRPHYLSNCNTALEFLRSKRVRTTSFCLFLQILVPSRSQCLRALCKHKLQSSRN